MGLCCLCTWRGIRLALLLKAILNVNSMDYAGMKPLVQQQGSMLLDTQDSHYYACTPDDVATAFLDGKLKVYMYVH